MANKKKKKKEKRIVSRTQNINFVQVKQSGYTVCIVLRPTARKNEKSHLCVMVQNVSSYLFDRSCLAGDVILIIFLSWRFFRFYTSSHTHTYTHPLSLHFVFFLPRFIGKLDQRLIDPHACFVCCPSTLFTHGCIRSFHFFSPIIEILVRNSSFFLLFVRDLTQSFNCIWFTTSDKKTVL